MSIYVQATVSDAIFSHPRYAITKNKITSMDGSHFTVGYLYLEGQAGDEGFGYRVWRDAYGDRHYLEARLEEGARKLPNGFVRELVTDVRLTSTFNCAKLRQTGRYAICGANGTGASATLTRIAPKLEELKSLKADGSFLHALSLLVGNALSIQGTEHAVFELYYQIRGGDIQPHESWDGEQK